MEAITRPHGGKYYKPRAHERKKTYTWEQWIHHKRNGCMFCGMDLRFPNNHLSIMRRTHPKAWDVLMRKKGLGKVLLQLRLALDDGQLDMFEQTFGLDEYLDRFPCAFDRI